MDKDENEMCEELYAWYKRSKTKIGMRKSLLAMISLIETDKNKGRVCTK